jgi:predicted glycosyl hydrolase (DUF1957 family)
MPTYTIALAHDTSFYGWWVSEGDTWEEAVASLTSDRLVRMLRRG